VYRGLEGEQKKLTSKLNYRKTKFATMELGQLPIDDKKMKMYIQKKSGLKNEISALEEEIQEIKIKKKGACRMIAFSELPENEKFDNAINDRKRLLDTVKMIAYRAETAMANIIRPIMSHPNESRVLLQQIYQTDANIYPDYKTKILSVEIHKLTYWKDDKILHKLCDGLNKTETKFPGTGLTIFYKVVSK